MSKLNIASLHDAKANPTELATHCLRQGQCHHYHMDNMPRSDYAKAMSDNDVVEMTSTLHMNVGSHSSDCHYAHYAFFSKQNVISCVEFSASVHIVRLSHNGYLSPLLLISMAHTLKSFFTTKHHVR